MATLHLNIPKKDRVYKIVLEKYIFLLKLYDDDLGKGPLITIITCI